MKSTNGFRACILCELHILGIMLRISRIRCCYVCSYVFMVIVRLCNIRIYI